MTSPSAEPAQRAKNVKRAAPRCKKISGAILGSREADYKNTIWLEDSGRIFLSRKPFRRTIAFRAPAVGEE
jgi:hypothetical protein